MILIHYGEIHTKGQNRGYFLKTLQRNIRAALPNSSVTLDSHRFLVHAPKEAMDRMGQIFGVVSYAWAETCKPTLEEIQKKALEVAMPATWPLKVIVKRADKAFPSTSTEIGQKIAQYLEKNGVNLAVKGHPSELSVEILQSQAIIYAGKRKGLGGLPVGTAGKVVTLLSGGIDSPVASFLLAKRGVSNLFVHFHPFKPGEEKAQKIEDLIRQLYPYTLAKKIYLVPYAPFTLCALGLPERQVLPVFRRFMLKVAEQIALKENAKAIGTGENLGQVASQTLDNLAAIEEVTVLPVLRPCLTYDKQEIIGVAQKIGTYEISIQTYNDCCSSLVSKHPATRCTAEELKRIEGDLPAELLEKTLKETKIIQVDVT